MRSRASGRKFTGRSLTDLAASRIPMAYLDEPRPQRKRSFSNSLAAPSDAKRVETPQIDEWPLSNALRTRHSYCKHFGALTHLCHWPPKFAVTHNPSHGTMC